MQQIKNIKKHTFAVCLLFILRGSTQRKTTREGFWRVKGCLEGIFGNPSLVQIQGKTNNKTKKIYKYKKTIRKTHVVYFSLFFSVSTPVFYVALFFLLCLLFVFLCWSSRMCTVRLSDWPPLKGPIRTKNDTQKTNKQTQHTKNTCFMCFLCFCLCSLLLIVCFLWTYLCFYLFLCFCSLVRFVCFVLTQPDVHGVSVWLAPF